MIEDFKILQDEIISYKGSNYKNYYNSSVGYFVPCGIVWYPTNNTTTIVKNCSEFPDTIIVNSHTYYIVNASITGKIRCYTLTNNLNLNDHSRLIFSSDFGTTWSAEQNGRFPIMQHDELGYWYDEYTTAHHYTLSHTLERSVSLGKPLFRNREPATPYGKPIIPFAKQDYLLLFDYGSTTTSSNVSVKVARAGETSLTTLWEHTTTGVNLQPYIDTVNDIVYFYNASLNQQKKYVISTGILSTISVGGDASKYFSDQEVIGNIAPNPGYGVVNNATSEYTLVNQYSIYGFVYWGQLLLSDWKQYTNMFASAVSNLYNASIANLSAQYMNYKSNLGIYQVIGVNDNYNDKKIINKYGENCHWVNQVQVSPYMDNTSAKQGIISYYPQRSNGTYYKDLDLRTLLPGHNLITFQDQDTVYTIKYAWSSGGDIIYKSTDGLQTKQVYHQFTTSYHTNMKIVYADANSVWILFRRNDNTMQLFELYSKTYIQANISHTSNMPNVDYAYINGYAYISTDYPCTTSTTICRINISTKVVTTLLATTAIASLLSANKRHVGDNWHISPLINFPNNTNPSWSDGSYSSSSYPSILTTELQELGYTSFDAYIPFADSMADQLGFPGEKRIIAAVLNHQDGSLRNVLMTLPSLPPNYIYTNSKISMII